MINNNGLIIAIDASQEILSLFKAILIEENYSIQLLCQPDSINAFNLVKAIQPALVILESTFTEKMDSLGLIALLQADETTTNIPLIVTTTNIDKTVSKLQIVPKPEQLKFLPKPFEIEELLALVANSIKQTQLI